MYVFTLLLTFVAALIPLSANASSDYGLIIQDAPKYNIWQNMPHSVELRGMVVDNTGAPLTNASVSFGEEHILTDALGYFSFDKRVSPKLQITVTHPEFIPLKSFVAGVFNPYGTAKIQLTRLNDGIEVSDAGFYSEDNNYIVQGGPNTFQHPTKLLVGSQQLQDSYSYTGWPELQRRAAFYIKSKDSSPILKPITIKVPVEYTSGVSEPVLLHRYNTSQEYTEVDSDIMFGNQIATLKITEPGFYVLADKAISIIPEPSFLTADFNGDGFVSPHDGLVNVKYEKSSNYSLRINSPTQTFNASVYKKDDSKEIVSSFIPTDACNIFPLKDASYSSMDSDIPSTVYNDILVRTGFDKPVTLGGASDTFQYPNLTQALLLRVTAVGLLERAAITSLEREYLDDIMSKVAAKDGFVAAKVVGDRYANINAGDIIYIAKEGDALTVYKTGEEYVIRSPERLIYFNCAPQADPVKQKLAQVHPELPYTNHTQFRFTREGNVLSIDYHPLEQQKPKKDQAYCGAVIRASFNHSPVNSVKVIHDEYKALEELSGDLSYGARLTDAFTNSYIPINADSVVSWESNNRTDAAHHMASTLTASYTLQPWKRVLSLDAELRNKKNWYSDGNIAFAQTNDGDVFLKVIQKDNTAKYYKAGKPHTVRNNIGFAIEAKTQTACTPSEIKEAMKQTDPEPSTITIEHASAELEGGEVKDSAEKKEAAEEKVAEKQEVQKPKSMPLISLPKIEMPEFRWPSFELPEVKLPSFSSLFSSDDEEKKEVVKAKPEAKKPAVEKAEKKIELKPESKPVEVVEEKKEEAEPEPVKQEVVEDKESKAPKSEVITLKNTDIAVSTAKNPAQEPSYIELEPMSSPLFDDEITEKKSSGKKQDAIIDPTAFTQEIESWLDF